MVYMQMFHTIDPLRFKGLILHLQSPPRAYISAAKKEFHSGSSGGMPESARRDL